MKALAERPRPAAAHGIGATVAWSARAAFTCATLPMKAAVTGGRTADEQLAAMARGFADLVASEWGRALSLLDVTAIPEAAANRVRRHRTLLATLARNVLASGHACGEFEVAEPERETRRWIALADSLPRWLAVAPERQRRATARWVFESLAEDYRAMARITGLRRHARPCPPVART